jgi:hypothetical protein
MPKAGPSRADYAKAIADRDQVRLERDLFQLFLIDVDKAARKCQRPDASADDVAAFSAIMGLLRAMVSNVPWGALDHARYVQANNRERAIRALEILIGEAP